MRGPASIRVAAAVALASALGCAEQEFEPPDRVQRLGEAEALFAEVRFDTIVWDSEEARAFTGNETFAARCRNCHGTLGRGNTPYAEERGLAVPSLVEPAGAYALSIDSLRHRIFVGHVNGMPTWGVAGLSLREIDGSAFYILERLRPEVLGR